VHELFAALADPTRLRIINLLQQGEVCVCDLEAVLQTTQSNVSRHLAKLRSAGAVATRKQAQWIYYSLKPEFALNNAELIKYMLGKMKGSAEHQADLKKLADHLQEKHCEELTQ